MSRVDNARVQCTDRLHEFTLCGKISLIISGMSCQRCSSIVNKEVQSGLHDYKDPSTPAIYSSNKSKV